LAKSAIRVQALGKRYQLGDGARYQALRDRIGDALKAPLRARGRSADRSGGPDSGRRRDHIWALRNVSFEVEQGELVGIIGRNGAGKSTLLKILSRITKPTRGWAETVGRVGSLLEVGTGFHPELTGRENVYLNGAVLGMKKMEIERKFDEIVAFADIERFLDTPVKRYSSGMELRLGFAVAAHLEPEILIVDEVLAVGDAAFQRKCMAKMEDVGGEGRTVLFVSHNMPAITRLCDRTILLEAGGVIADGPSPEVVTRYLRSGLGTTAARVWDESEAAPGSETARLRAARILDERGRVAEAVDIRRPVFVEMEFEVLRAGHVLVPNFHFTNEEGITLFVAVDQDPEWRRQPREPGRYTSRARIPANLLAEGTLVVAVAVSTFEPLTVHFHERDAIAFQVVDSMEGDSARGDYAGSLPGVVRPLLEWETDFQATPSGSRV
jgi:lipopolysaccharide transport system ATP-binding protein